jgi:hypothetical protein
MKHRSFYSFLILLFLSACLAEQTNELIVPNCHDGIQNQDETEIDCGGRCTACEVIIPVVTPCASSLEDDTYTWNGLDYTLAADDIGCYEETDYFEIFVYNYYYSHELTIHFPSKPTEDKIYQASWNLYPEGDEAYIGFHQGFLFKASAGEVYVHVNNGIVTAEFCDVTMNNTYFDPVSLKGRITCK